MGTCCVVLLLLVSLCLGLFCCVRIVGCVVGGDLVGVAIADSFGCVELFVVCFDVLVLFDLVRF